MRQFLNNQLARVGRAYSAVETWARAHVVILILTIVVLWMLDRFGIFGYLIEFGVWLGVEVFTSKAFWMILLGASGLLLSEIIRRWRGLSSGKTELVTYAFGLLSATAVFWFFGFPSVVETPTQPETQIVQQQTPPAPVPAPKTGDHQLDLVEAIVITQEGNWEQASKWAAVGLIRSKASDQKYTDQEVLDLVVAARQWLKGKDTSSVSSTDIRQRTVQLVKDAGGVKLVGEDGTLIFADEHAEAVRNALASLVR